MSKRYEQIKKYYESGLWSEKRVHDAVQKNVITAAEYTQITGKTYQ